MKKITSILSLVIVLAMAFSMTAFAEGANEFTVSTNVDSVAAGDEVVGSVVASGDWADVALTQLSIDFDETKFSVDTEIDWDVEWEYCWDYEWYEEIMSTSGKKENLTRISAPAPGVKDGMFNVIYLSTKGTSLTDKNSNLYTGGTTTVAMVKFTALADVDAIDASCFELKNVKVEEADSTAHAITINQLAAAGGDDPIVPDLAEDEVEDLDFAVVPAAEEDTDFEYGTGVMLQFTKKADFTDMIWAFTTEDDKKLYSAAKEIDIAEVGIGSPVILTASFANGNKALYEYDEVKPVVIKAVNAIFKAGEAEYFTDLTDKK